MTKQKKTKLEESLRGHKIKNEGESQWVLGFPLGVGGLGGGRSDLIREAAPPCVRGCVKVRDER